MILIFGGAYQGKLDYAQEVFGPGLTVSVCAEDVAEPDLNGAILSCYHLLVLAQLRKGIDPQAYIQAHEAVLREKIILCEDISCGVVPVDAEMRRWREAVGRCMGMLSRQAESVIRVFCGIGMKLK
jgi:adenosyl cobinamide kinase/adenosyl cobinamide phosphate guanylyltransferase